jgi:hypothetical protein
MKANTTICKTCERKSRCVSKVFPEILEAGKDFNPVTEETIIIPEEELCPFHLDESVIKWGHSYSSSHPDRHRNENGVVELYKNYYETQGHDGPVVTYGYTCPVCKAGVDFDEYEYEQCGGRFEVVRDECAQ